MAQLENRPYLHFEKANSSPDCHEVGFLFFQKDFMVTGTKVDSQPGKEAEITVSLSKSLGQKLNYNNYVINSKSTSVIGEIESVAAGLDHHTNLFTEFIDDIKSGVNAGPKPFKPYLYFVESKPDKEWIVHVTIPVPTGGTYSYKIKKPNKFKLNEKIRVVEIEVKKTNSNPGVEFLFPEIKISAAERKKNPDGTFKEKFIEIVVLSESNKKGSGTVKYDDADDKPTGFDTK